MLFLRLCKFLPKCSIKLPIEMKLFTKYFLCYLVVPPKLIEIIKQIHMRLTWHSYRYIPKEHEWFSMSQIKSRNIQLPKRPDELKTTTLFKPPSYILPFKKARPPENHI